MVNGGIEHEVIFNAHKYIELECEVGITLLA
jgi:hypothetical protein